MWKIFERKKEEITKDLIDDAEKHIQKKVEEKKLDTLACIVPVIFVLMDFAPILPSMGRIAKTVKPSKTVFNNCTINIFTR